MKAHTILTDRYHKKITILVMSHAAYTVTTMMQDINSYESLVLLLGVYLIGAMTPHESAPFIFFNRRHGTLLIHLKIYHYE